MKKVMILFAFVSIFLLSVISAACSLNVSMINQDPYPAIPGEAVKIVFQINGVADPNCEIVEFGVEENFPFTVDKESTNPVIINSGIYAKNYSSFYIAPYKIRIDADALEGDTPIEVYYSSSSTTYTGTRLQRFNIYVEDTRTDFEIFVKDYDSKTMTLEVLNIGEVDVEALTIEVPKQDNIELKGTNKVIVGDLDSNEYTTADFEASSIKDGEINLTLTYTDSINVRRTIEKTITFDSSYFADRNKTSQPIWLYILILLIVGFFGWKWYKKHKQHKKLHHKE